MQQIIPIRKVFEGGELDAHGNWIVPPTLVKEFDEEGRQIYPPKFDEDEVRRIVREELVRAGVILDKTGDI